MIDAAVYSLLSSASAVTTLASTRVYPVTVPQQPTFPCVTYQVINSSGRDLHHSGHTAAARTIFQITCYASTAAAAKQLAKACEAVFHGYSGSVAGETIFFGQVVNEVDLYDPDSQLYAVAVDVLLVHRI